MWEQKKQEITEALKDSLKDLPQEVQQKIISDKLLQELKFDNTSGETLKSLEGKSETSLKNEFISYLNGYTENIREIIEKSGIKAHINKLHTEKILYSLIKNFSEIDLNPSDVSNIKMGYIFEELVRKFSEQNNEEAGEHYTPREVIELMIQLLGMDEDGIKDGELKTIYDPACGTGGMLTAAKEYIEKNINPKANVRIYGQEVNDKTWAIAEADLILKGEIAEITKGDTLTDDGFVGEQFDYMLSNPPYGKSWKNIKTKVIANSNGRFHDTMLPRSSDGQLLFTLHMISKMKPAEMGGSKIAIVHNGSPLFSGDAGSGESEIRKFIIENDWLETIVALPTDLFYNTGIATYIWILRNNKQGTEREGRFQLINATSFWKKRQRSLGNKRKDISEQQIEDIVQLHKDFAEGEFSKIYDKDDFAYRKVYLDLEELEEDGLPAYETIVASIPQGKLKLYFETDAKTLKEMLNKEQEEEVKKYTLKLKPNTEFTDKYNTPDVQLTISKRVSGNRLSFTTLVRVPKIVKDTEIIPWKEDVEEFLNREVEKKWTITKEEKGYEIPFTKEFYVYQPLRDLQEVMGEFVALEQENKALLNDLGLTL